MSGEGRGPRSRDRRSKQRRSGDQRPDARRPDRGAPPARRDDRRRDDRQRDDRPRAHGRDSSAGREGHPRRGDDRRLRLVATCAMGIEELLADELRQIGAQEVRPDKGAVRFEGHWPDVWRANWRLRTANRVLLRLAAWPAMDGEQLTAGARRLVQDPRVDWAGTGGEAIFDPDATLAIRASTSASRLTDVRWVALKVKDGIVDGQRARFRRRSSVDKRDPDRSFRLWLHRDRATLLYDTSGEPLDRRGYRRHTTEAPLREQLAAACVLASGWDGRGPVLDPMCGSGTLLAEAGWIALGRAPGCLRKHWAFQKLPGFHRSTFQAIRREPIPAPGPGVQLLGSDRNPTALAVARTNLQRAKLDRIARLEERDAFDLQPPPGPGLLVVNPAYGARLEEDPEQWKRLGDLLKQRFQGWRAVVIAGDAGKGKWIGLRPKRRLPVRNGPLEARILVFDLY